MSLAELMTGINWLAVLVARAATLVIGFVWYLPPLLGAAWATRVSRWTGAAERELLQPSNPAAELRPWAIVFAVNVVGLALLLNGLGASSLADAALVAIVATLGFAMSLLSWTAIFAAIPLGVFLINSGAFLTMQLVASAILVTLR